MNGCQNLSFLFKIPTPSWGTILNRKGIHLERSLSPHPCTSSKLKPCADYAGLTSQAMKQLMQVIIAF